jgi:hypothetical protein
VFNKLDLPSEDNKELQKFKKKLNDYLAELANYPTKETIEFLTMDRSDQIELKDNNEPSDNLELLRAFWSTESLVKVEVTVDKDLQIEEDIYTISISYYDVSAKLQMKLMDIFKFYNTMRRRYKGFPFTRLPHASNLPAISPKDLVKKLRSFFVEILNDIDILGSTVYSFFNFYLIRKLCKLPEIISTLNLSNFIITATVKKISLGIQIQKHLILVPLLTHNRNLI